LATHGFFAPAGLRSAIWQSGPPARGLELIPTAEWTDMGSQRGEAGIHPGLLSGIALAGANRGPQATGRRPGEVADDGILTALEVAELDLGSAELVVLSACETGLGEVADGEGLLGLQRAFQMAGARTVLASLWQVEDTATQQLMTAFYENLWKNRLSPAEALRRAQLAILKGDSGRASPRAWAAWVLSGDPGRR
jgi:CHAT domain-containing protein